MKFYRPTGIFKCHCGIEEPRRSKNQKHCKTCGKQSKAHKSREYNRNKRHVIQRTNTH